MPVQTIQVTDIGAVALGLLVEEPRASVMGSTSLGVFLRLDSSWVIFITPEADHGPLTLNYPPEAGGLPALGSGTRVKIQAGRISFPETGIEIHTHGAASWKAPGLPKDVLPPEQRKARLDQIVRQALAQGRASSLSVLLPALLGHEDRSNYRGIALFAQLERLERVLRARQDFAIAKHLKAFLGLGNGLTPSGDDLASGLLLALARWGGVLAPRFDLDALASALLPLAYRSTTTLSANLIDCSLRGQANQRLLLALDGIMTGTPGADACAEALAGWGHTSGLDALVGMALGVGSFSGSW